jgi:hypothetical protein
MSLIDAIQELRSGEFKTYREIDNIVVAEEGKTTSSVSKAMEDAKTKEQSMAQSVHVFASMRPPR